MKCDSANARETGCNYRITLERHSPMSLSTALQQHSISFTKYINFLPNILLVYYTYTSFIHSSQRQTKYNFKN